MGVTANQVKGLLLLLGFEQRTRSVFKYTISDIENNMYYGFNIVQVFDESVHFQDHTVHLYEHIDMKEIIPGIQKAMKEPYK